MTRAYLGGKTYRECVVECPCGHKSYGKEFYSVESRDPDDAWWQHRLHVDATHPETRVPQTESRRLRLEEALDEIRRVLNRVS